MDAITAASATGDSAVSGEIGDISVSLDSTNLRVLEPGIATAAGTALGEIGGAPVAIVNEIGEGRTFLLNATFERYDDRRMDEGIKPTQEMLVAAVRSAGVEPPATVRRADGALPTAVQTVQFGTAPLRYLAVERDILMRGAGQEDLVIEIDEPAVVYDIRAGERVGEGRIDHWETTIDRGYPQVYALLPYEVNGVEATMPGSAEAGSTVEVAATVSASARPGTHVVRMDVYAPDADEAHREYSRNILCERGEGATDIPFAHNDATGNWRLELTDVASGTSLTRTLALN
jgi:hypothetical protein